MIRWFLKRVKNVIKEDLDLIVDKEGSRITIKILLFDDVVIHETIQL